MAENTFLGLQPYTEADAYRFKGRTEESHELFRLIVRNDFTVCYAESGEGKTSLLNAGVSPLLRQNMYFPIAITFTSDDYQHTPDSFDTIIDRCIKDSIADYNEKNKGVNIEYKLCSTDFQNTDYQSALQQELSKFSWWKLRNYKPQAMGLTFTPVFVFDQFEEVFNLPGSIVWTKKFFDWLEDVSSDSCPDEIVNKVREIIGTNAVFPAIKEDKDFKAVFSLRKEFIGELDYWGMQKCFIPSLKDNRYCLKALTYEGAQKVMTQQERFAEDKVEHVLRYFVQQYSREPEKTITEKLPVIPALLLSVVCDSWEKDIDFFSSKNESEIGQSLNKIIEQFYNNKIRKIVNDFIHVNEEITKKIDKSSPFYGIEPIGEDFIRNEIEGLLVQLVDRNGKRERAKTTSSRFSQIGFDEKYKKILCNNRIIKVSKIDGEDYVEIVHDALCPIIAKRKEQIFVEEAKKQEEQKLRELAKKNRKRMMMATTIGISIIGILLFFLWQNNRILKEQKARNQSEAARDSAQQQKDIVQEYLNLSETQKDSLKRRNDAIALLYDSISQLNKSLTDKVVIIEQQKENMESQYKLLVEQIEINRQQESMIKKMQLKPVYDAVIALRDAIAAKDTFGIRKAANELQGRTSYFSSLRNADASNSVPSNIIYREENSKTDSIISNMDKNLLSDIIEKSNTWGGQTADNHLLTKTCFVKANQSTKYKFASKGHQEIAVVAEPGGLITLKIHVTNSAGLDKRFDDTIDIKKGRQQRTASFDLPSDRRNTVELEVINCTQKDISFVVISN